MAQSGTLQEMLVAAHDSQMANIYTIIPGIIVTVKDMGGLYVDVQPTINLRDQDGDSFAERPPILNVPLMMPVSKQGGLTFPVSVGTPVELRFSMRGLDVWKRSNGYPTTSSDYRKFDIRDCIATPGLYPMSESPNDPAKRSLPHDPSDVVLVHNIGRNEVEIRLKANGDVEVTSPTKIIMNAPEIEANADQSFTVNSPTIGLNGQLTQGKGSYSGQMFIQGPINVVTDVIANGVSLTGHTHGGVQTGGGNTNEPNR